MRPSPGTADGGRCAVALLVAALVAGAAPWSAAASAQDVAQRPVSSVYEQWLQEARFLLDAERAARFEAIPASAFVAKERFIDAFWESRPPAQRGRFERNRRAAAEMRLRSELQLEVVRIAGPPRSIEDLPSCDSILRRLQLWHWDPALLTLQTGSPWDGGDLTVAFVQTSSFDPRSFEVLTARSAPEQLTFVREDADPIEQLLAGAVRQECISRQRADELASTLERAPDRAELVELLGWRRGVGPMPALATGGATDRFGAGTLRLEPTGSYFRTTIVRGEVALPVETLATLDGRSLFERIEIVGDVRRDGRLIEGFEVVHHVVGTPPRDGRVRVDFYRKLRPGEYTLALRVRRGDGVVLLRTEPRLQVAAASEPAPEPPGRRGGLAQLTRDRIVQLTALPQVRLRSRVVDRVADRVELEAAVSGGPIAGVDLLRDGELVQRLERAPFVATVATTADTHRFAAVARDDQGREQARDELVIQRRDRPLRVRFAALRSARDPGGEHRRLAVELSLPLEAATVRLRCYLNALLLEERVLPRAEVEAAGGPAGSSQLSCPISRPPFAGLAFARVEASLDDGAAREDLVILSGQRPEEVEILLEEVFVTAVDSAGAPVVGVQGDEISLQVGGEPRPLERVEPVEDLPLDVALLLDSSSSMGRRVRAVSAGAAGFFDDVLRPGDRAALLSFSDDLVLRVPWSGHQEVAQLRAGAGSLRSHGTTRLYDSIVYGLASFTSGGGRRALVVLSDGADTESDHGLEQVLDAARRGGVAIFPVALGEFGTLPTAELRRLAEESGGAFFDASVDGDLGQIFARIERLLRTQYRLTFRADPEGPLRLAPVTVRIDRPGVTVRTVVAPRG